MKNHLKAAVLAIVLIVMSVQVQAAPWVFSSEFSGDETKIPNLLPPGEADSTASRVTLELDTFTVGQSGVYQFKDARNAGWLDVSVHLYRDTFSASAPEAGLVDRVDDFGEVQLEMGTNYLMVVQPWLEGDEVGAFGMVIDGPGTPSAPAIELPDNTSGSFDGTETLTNIIPEFIGCPDTYHDVVGPMQFDRSGVYQFGGYNGFNDEPLVLAVGVYDSAFDPANPYENQLAFGQDGTLQYIEAGMDYWVVVTPDCEVKTGDWGFVAAAPRIEMFWGSNMGGAWFDPTTAGQGILLDVSNVSGNVFGAWFTWDTTPPDSSITSVIGDPGNRWLTAQGLPADPTAFKIELPLFNISGGVFNSTDTVAAEQVGTLTLDAHNSCEGGTMSWDMSNGTQGSAAFQRISRDGLEDCYFQVYSFISGPYGE